jgi:hypothetical protein
LIRTISLSRRTVAWFPDSNTHTHANTDTDANADSDAYSNSNANPDSNAYTTARRLLGGLSNHRSVARRV